MKKTTPQQKTSSTKKAAVGVGLAALAAAAAGTYFFYTSKDAKKNRAVAKAWSVKAKNEVIKEIKKASDVTEKGYLATVKAVAERYKKLQKLDAKDVNAFISELKGHWKNISKEMKTSAQKTVAKKTSTKKPIKK